MGIYSLLILSIGIAVFAILYSHVKIKSFKKNILFFLFLCSYVIGFILIHHQIENTCEILIQENISDVLTIIRSWGWAAPLLSILLMILQAVLAPLPAFLITAANGIIFGIFWGIVISTVGALLGALLSFYISRWFYNHYAATLLKDKKTRRTIEDISSKHGFKVILLARLIPIISFDLVSYAAGLSTIKVSYFLLATFIGMLPATVAYTVLANSAGKIAKLSNEFIVYSTLVALLLLFFWCIKGRLTKSHNSKKE